MINPQTPTKLETNKKGNTPHEQEPPPKPLPHLQKDEEGYDNIFAFPTEEKALNFLNNDHQKETGQNPNLEELDSAIDHMNYHSQNTYGYDVRPLDEIFN